MQKFNGIVLHCDTVTKVQDPILIIQMLRTKFRIYRFTGCYKHLKYIAVHSKFTLILWKSLQNFASILGNSYLSVENFIFYPCIYLQICLGIQVLPVMVMGAFIPGLRRKYPVHEYISAILLVIGLILFTLADAQASPNFSIVGVVMVSGALVMDSFLGNLQEAIFAMNPETTQVIHIVLLFFLTCRQAFAACTMCSFWIPVCCIKYDPFSNLCFRWRCCSVRLSSACLS